MKRSCPDYNTLCEALTPLVTEAWKPQLNNLALFVYGLLLAGHVHLPKIALTLPVPGNTQNALQRLERFLKNKAIQPTLWYEGVAKAVLAAWKGREIASRRHGRGRQQAMYTKQSLKRLGLLMGALLVATITTGWLSRPEPILIDISHTIGPFNPKKQTWNWLSAQELIVVTTDTEPDNLLGAVSDEIHWQGHVELWNVSTGKRTRLSGLTTLLNREGVTPYEIPASFTLSPNRTWLVWHNHKSEDGWPFPAAAHLDGTHFREWNSDTRGYGFFTDDQHWVEHDVSDPSTVHIVDLEDKRKDRKYPAAAPQAKAVLALHAVQEPHFVNVDFSNQQHVVEIATYRTEDWAVFERSVHDSRDRAPHPLSKSTLKLPSGTNLLRGGGQASPDQRLVLYHLHTEHTNPVLAFLHRILPKVSEAHVETESLWVSKANGQGFYEIGHVVVPQHSKEPQDSELSGVEWIPGSKQVAFFYHKRLSVVPVK